MTLDRQQRRARRRQLAGLARQVTARGLPVSAPADEVLAIALGIHDQLTDRTRDDRASAAAATMHAVFEASMRAAPPRLTLACRKGCSYCCHNWVGATAPELLAIARHLTARPHATPTRGKPSGAPPSFDLASLDVRLSRTRGITIADRFGAKLPCALLVDGACSIYATRPTVCRQTTSVDLAACLDEFDGRDAGGDMTVSRVVLDHAANCQLALRAALSASDLPQATYELSAGLTAALAPDAEARWLAGDDVFAGVAQGPADAVLARGTGLLASEIRSLK